jgi:hypothetical protein
MSKKLILACMALVAFAALALPALASAHTLTENGVPLKVGSKITATNIGEAFLRDDKGENELSKCSKVVMTGELTKNEDNKPIEGTITTATFSGTGALASGMNECTGLGGLTPTTNGGGVDGENVVNGTPWCVKTVPGTDEFEVRGNACNLAARPISFILDTTLTGACTYERKATEPVKGEFTTEVTGDAVLKVKPNANSTFKRSAGSVLCPEQGTLEMSFTLETDEPGVKPLTISPP